MVRTGDASAQLELSRIYLWGWDNEQQHDSKAPLNPERGHRYLLAAAEAGNAVAQVRIFSIFPGLLSPRRHPHPHAHPLARSHALRLTHSGRDRPGLHGKHPGSALRRRQSPAVPRAGCGSWKRVRVQQSHGFPSIQREHRWRTERPCPCCSHNTAMCCTARGACEEVLVS